MREVTPSITMDPAVHIRGQSLERLARGKLLTDERIEHYERLGFYGTVRRDAARLRDAVARAKRLPPLTTKEIRKRYKV